MASHTPHPHPRPEAGLLISSLRSAVMARMDASV